MALVELGDFKGNPVIILKDKEDSQYPTSLGRKKCQLIIANIAAVRRFAEFGDVVVDSQPVNPATETTGQATGEDDNGIPF